MTKIKCHYSYAVTKVVTLTEAKHGIAVPRNWGQEARKGSYVMETVFQFEVMTSQVYITVLPQTDGKESSQETGWSQPWVYCMPRNVETWLLWSRRLRSGKVFLMLPCEDVAKVRVPSWQTWLVPHLIPHLPAKEGRGELSSPTRKLPACQTVISTSGLTLDLLGPHAPPGMKRQNQHPLTLRLKNLCHWNTVSPWD